MELRRMGRYGWLRENIELPCTILTDGELIDKDCNVYQENIESSLYDTVLIYDKLEYDRNPVQTLMEAHRVTKDKIYIVVPDKRTPNDSDYRRMYNGRILFDQCLKAGIREHQIKIDHINEENEDRFLGFYLATINSDVS